MTHGEKEEWLSAITTGNLQGMEFLSRWGDYLRAIDNVLDEDQWDRVHLTRAFALGCDCFSSQFYIRNLPQLQMIVLVATCILADSVSFEKSPELWKRQWADVLRHADGHVVLAVALICGGWDHVRKLSPVFLTAAYYEHKQNHGIPA